ncbi:MAG TPA: RraA family protein [Terriglobia bacterium]|nr:RraA family protein [Terriglobia bacterium]
MISTGPTPADLPLIERLAAIPYTGAVTDILDEMGYRHQVLPHEIQSLVPGQTVAGRALTLRGEPCEIDDPDVIFPPFLKMLGEIRPGDVITTQANDNVSAHLGELSSETAKFRGARGAVIDGGARDTEYMVRLGFPVFARYKTPADIRGRWRLVEWNVPIVIGSVSISPGDLVLGDRDGAIIIPQKIAEEVVTKAEEVVQTENQVRAAILRGVLPLEAYQRFGRF